MVVPIKFHWNSLLNSRLFQCCSFRFLTSIVNWTVFKISRQPKPPPKNTTEKFSTHNTFNLNILGYWLEPACLFIGVSQVAHRVVPSLTKQVLVWKHNGRRDLFMSPANVVLVPLHSAWPQKWIYLHDTEMQCFNYCWSSSSFKWK